MRAILMIGLVLLGLTTSSAGGAQTWGIQDGGSVLVADGGTGNPPPEPRA